LAKSRFQNRQAAKDAKREEEKLFFAFLGVLGVLAVLKPSLRQRGFCPR
jgi:hypothetical protein